ncbi:hypothetical protein B0H34DRAFT_794953 [Crassisporium funariophilum]|nr:hypothetical protein B0H34DRAFT_794953 [Crassisporium funariophilum]
MRVVLLVSACLATTSARLLHSLPEDTYAFPKFRVAFMNGLPVLNETAERWLKQGLRGGELEFLDQPWRDGDWDTPSNRKEIGSGNANDHEPLAAIPESSSSLETANYTLEHMRMGPRDSYICLIPKPLDSIPSFTEEESDVDVTPARSWSLLQPLSGTCLYHRQGWFTYSYCHNDEIRQFKEAVPTQSRFTGTYKPEEDHDWESYTLGRAPPNPEPGVDLTVAEQDAQAVNLELARSAGSRYLVQRWGDGTICDKTGKGREVEVQFHCSMVMTDHILFVKEAKTCSYVLVVHTPRLCGEPGFKSRRDAGEEAQIRCREVVDRKPEGQMKLPSTDHPMKVPMRKTVLPAPVPVVKGEKGEALSAKEKIFNDILRQTLEALITTKGGTEGANKNDDGEMIIELEDDSLEEFPLESDRLVEALRAAGYEVRAEVVTLKSEKEKEKQAKAQAPPPKKPRNDPHRDEL